MICLADLFASEKDLNLLVPERDSNRMLNEVEDYSARVILLPLYSGNKVSP